MLAQFSSYANLSSQQKGSNCAKRFIREKKKYAAIPSEQVRKDVPDGVMTKCPKCKNHVYERASKNLKVCVNCGYHHPMNAWERLDSILDEGSFREYDKEMVSLNPLEFPGYEEKLESDRKRLN